MRDKLKRIGRRAWRLFCVVLFALWRFLGRVGLAFRNILTWFVWQPLFYLTMPVWLPLHWLWEYLKEIWPPIWDFIGEVGLAQRRLLTRFVWRPFFTVVIRPLRWLYRRTVPPLAAWIRRLARRFWVHTTPQRTLYGRRLNSHWRVWRARVRILLKRPSLPEMAVMAPKQPRRYEPATRVLRLATAVAAVTLIIVVGAISMREPVPTHTVAADDATPITIVLTPTPVPASPTPLPTVAVKLTPWATPDPVDGGGAIVFMQHLNGNSDLYLLPVGQSDPIRLTTHPAADRDPAWSPDGAKIAFSSRRDGNWEIYVYDLAARELSRVTDDLAYDGAPTWSPDGQWLAYESYQDQNLDIFLIKADGTEGPLRLTRDPAPDFAPAWSPAGRHIAFTSWRGGGKDIYLRSLNDASGAFTLNVSASPGLQEDGAAFSPDGRFLTYHEDSAGFPVMYSQLLNDDFVPDGAPVSVGQQGRFPAWSPDSESIIYVYERGSRSFLMAGTPEAWGVLPQVYVSNGRIESPSWTAVKLTPEMANRLRTLEANAKEQPLYVEALAEPEAGEPPELLWPVSVNAPSPYLSDQVDQSFAALRQRVLEAAGWDFLGSLDGMFEAIDARPLPGQPLQSWNKAGRAFDFNYREALGFEPQVEVVKQQVGTETYWRIFVRTVAQDGSQGEPLRALSWDFQARSGDDPSYYEQGGKWKEAIPSGYYIDFTALAADYGWTWVPANSSWRTYFPDIRFWHYEKRDGFSWEEAMLQLYSEEEMTEVFGLPIDSQP